jgi:hypothetical protein
VFDALYKLTSSALRELSDSLKEGQLSKGLSSHMIQQIVGPSLTPMVVLCLEKLYGDGWTPKQIWEVVNAILQTRSSFLPPEELFDLVLSGPEFPGLPARDTSVVMRSMIEDCQQELLLIGYAIHQGRKLFERLAERMAERPELKVRFCLNISRNPTDTSLDSEIVRRFAHDFTSKQWPWTPKPEVLYDPRALSLEPSTRASLHAKCVVADGKTALVTSANFTEAAQTSNIEAGVVITYEPFVKRISEYFETLCQKMLRVCPLPEHCQ